MSEAKINIAPLVPMNILDHYTRRDYNQDKTQAVAEVYGALLGGFVDGVLEIRCSFPHRHSKKADGTFQLSLEFQKEMLELHHKIYPKDRVVGWYCTAFDPKIARAIHMYQKLSPSVLMVMDPCLQNGTLNTKCFKMTTATIGGEEIPNLFKEIPFDWKTRSNIEKIALDKMITTRHLSLKPILEGLPSELQTEDLQSCQRKPVVRTGTGMQSSSHGERPAFENVHKHLLQIQTVLKKSLDHVNAVVEGKAAEDAELGRELLSLIQSVPPVEAEAFDKLFNNTTQDMLMMNYLAKLTETQVQLMERLHVYIPDQKPNRNQEGNKEGGATQGAAQGATN
eukprot:TRINITY_DN4071_c0_g1_i1.p1 TRINITY_DN4071_c0_g1~~TRINITY_DN4071_c0_g1_i1.p1  ORF type:complete len:338 (+),score=172.98 TRINITY_DN4071_c0_g1_i1:111-1124(+)